MWKKQHKSVQRLIQSTLLGVALESQERFGSEGTASWTRRIIIGGHGGVRRCKTAGNNLFYWGQLWVVWYKWSMGPKELVSRAHEGWGRSGLCDMLMRSSDFIFCSTRVQWKVQSRRLIAYNVHLLVLSSRSWFASYRHFLMPRKTHWSYHSQRLQGTFHRTAQRSRVRLRENWKS